MKKILIIGGVIVAAAIIVGVIVGSGSKDGQNSITGSLTGSWQDLLSGSLGDDIMCEFEQSIADQGTLTVQTYISGDKLRVDYDMTGSFAGMNGEQKNLHIVSDGEYGYVWGDSMLGDLMGGMKYKIEYDEEGEMEMPDDDMMDAYMSLEDMPELNCQTWSVDESLFEIPDDIEFMDLDNLGEAMMGDMFNTTETESSDSESIGDGSGMVIDCSMCDMLDGELYTSCLESLGCE